jgi:hypothetical protein
VTRRHLLQTGGVASAAAIVGMRPWSAAEAQAAASDYDVSAYLLRSSFVALADRNFAITGEGGSTTAKLEALSDIQGDNLAGSEDAFSLMFSLGTPVPQGVYHFSHVVLGDFDLFLAPIQGHGYYEVVVNRSVGAPKHYPKPPSRPAPEPAPANPGYDDPSTLEANAPHKHGKQLAPPRHVRRLTARLLARGVVARVALGSDADVKRVSVWLTRGDKIVAAATVRNPAGRHVAVKLPTSHRLRGGRYALMVATKDREGREQYKRASVLL